jgi:hypothetical protein
MIGINGVDQLTVSPDDWDVEGTEDVGFPQVYDRQL